jgi:hypothetical protein
MWPRPTRREIRVSLLTRGQSARQSDPRLTVHVVVARDHNQPVTIKPGPIEELVKERRDQRVLLQLPREREIPRSEHRIRRAPLPSKPTHGPNQSLQHHVTVVRIASPKVEIRQM